jgi:hypothetical protein
MFVSPVDITKTFDSRDSYANANQESMELESEMDRLCKWSFEAAFFKFDMKEQR